MQHHVHKRQCRVSPSIEEKQLSLLIYDALYEGWERELEIGLRDGEQMRLRRVGRFDAELLRRVQDEVEG